MRLSDVPDMYEVVAPLSPFLPLIYKAYEGGTIQAQEIIEKHKFGFGGGIHATLTRAHVIQYLKTTGADIPWEITELGNDGIKITMGSIVIRAFKATIHGGMQKPKTQTVKNHLTQTDFTNLLEKTHHLLILWHANNKGDLTGLSLIYPLSYGVEKWRVDLLHPIFTADAPPPDVVAQEQESNEDYPVMVYQPRLTNWENLPVTQVPNQDFVNPSDGEDEDEEGYDLPLEESGNG